MRYGRAERLIQLALEMQSTRGGLTLGEIEEKFDVSRRTAIRMRDAVLRAFPQAKEVPTGDRTKRWRLPSGTAQTFTDLTPEDLAVLFSLELLPIEPGEGENSDASGNSRGG